MSHQRAAQRWQIVAWSLLAWWMCVASCTHEQVWRPPDQANQCDPFASRWQQTKDGQQLSQRLKESSEGALACLQLGWGQDAIEQAQSLFVLLKDNGDVHTIDEKAPSFSLPAGAENSKRRFRLFVFSPQFRRDTQLYCNTVMNDPSYACLGDSEDGTCLAEFEFRPSQDNLPAGQSATFPIGESQASCRLRMRMRAQETTPDEPPAEPQRDATDEPEPTPEPEPEPEPTPEPEPEPQPEPQPEPTPEPNPEPQPDVVGPGVPLCQGTACRWLKVSGGIGPDAIHSAKFAPNGDIIVAGTVQRSLPKLGKLAPVKMYGAADIFVARLNPKGVWLWAEVAGSTKDDACWAMDLDQQGNIYIGGHFGGPATFGSLQLRAPAGSRDGFVAKLDGSGKWLWVVNVAGRDDNDLTSLVVGPQGNVYIGGNFSTFINLSTPHVTGSDESQYIAKLNSVGFWQWSKGFSIGQTPRPSKHPRHKGPILAITTDASQQSSLVYAAEIEAGINLGAMGNLDFGNKGYNALAATLTLDGKWLKRFSFKSPNEVTLTAMTTAPNSQLTIAGLFRDQFENMGKLYKTSQGRVTYLISLLIPQGTAKWAVLMPSDHCFPRHMASSVKGHTYVTGELHGDCQFTNIRIVSAAKRGLFAARLNQKSRWTWASGGGAPYSKQNQEGVSGLSIAVSPNLDVVFAGSIFQPFIGTFRTATNRLDLQFFIASNLQP